MRVLFSLKQRLALKLMILTFEEHCLEVSIVLIAMDLQSLYYVINVPMMV